MLCKSQPWAHLSSDVPWCVLVQDRFQLVRIGDVLQRGPRQSVLDLDRYRTHLVPNFVLETCAHTEITNYIQAEGGKRRGQWRRPK
jgi:hypothetical protein